MHAHANYFVYTIKMSQIQEMLCNATSGGSGNDFAVSPSMLSAVMGAMV